MLLLSELSKRISRMNGVTEEERVLSVVHKADEGRYRKKVGT